MKKNRFYLSARMEGMNPKEAEKYSKKRIAEFVSNKKFPKKLWQK